MIVMTVACPSHQFLLSIARPFSVNAGQLRLKFGAEISFCMLTGAQLLLIIFTAAPLSCRWRTAKSCWSFFMFKINLAFLSFLSARQLLAMTFMAILSLTHPVASAAPAEVRSSASGGITAEQSTQFLD